MKKFSLLTFLLPLSVMYAEAQDLPVVVEAESGVAGSDWVANTEQGTTSVSTKTDLINASYPGNASKVITYTVTFPRPGVYDLYARLRVGAGAASDDSYYYGKGLGAKTPTADNNEWVTCNNLHNKGYSNLEQSAVVEGGGTTGTRVWKWVNMSEFNGGETPATFTVPEGALTQTFQIGGRENGLEFDKFVFGLSGKYFTVSNLNNGQPGADTKPVPFIPSGNPLAYGQPKYLGNVYSGTGTQTPYFANYWNQVAPGNGGKWGVIERVRDVMNWTELDAAYKLAKDNGFPFRMHVLVWGNQQPSWVENLPPAEQLEEIKEWFAAVAARYPDIDLIEVVNEPTNDPPSSPGNGGGNYINALGGTGATGWDWIITSFQLARQYFPNTKLMINEYNLEGSVSRTDRYIQIIDLLKERNLIDAIGTQAHAFSTRGTASSIKNFLDKLAATGLPLYATEMDIDGVDANGELNDQIHLEEYKRIFPVYWEHPAVKGITLAGWRPGMWRTAQGAFLAYSDNTERPALVWLREYVRNSAPVIIPSQVLSIREGAAAGATVGAVQASDKDAGQSLQNWRIVGGTGASLFRVDPATGVITLAGNSSLDFEATTSYTLRLAVNDGYTTSAEETMVVNVANENDNAPVVSVSQGFALDAGFCNTVGTLTAADADDTNQSGFTAFRNWQITGGTGAAIFAINPTNGEITIANPLMLDFSNDSYTLSVTVTDGLNTSAEENVIITIPKKVSVCHKGKNISVSKNAVLALIRQGDCIGSCSAVGGIAATEEKSAAFAESPIQVYPNPVQDKIHVVSGADSKEIQQIDIVDLSGRTLLRRKVDGQASVTLPTDGLQPGVYFVRVQTDKVMTYKIVKQ